ncbi:MAG: DMT family transporter, partial [Acidimicrobiia bacterium]
MAAALLVTFLWSSSWVLIRFGMRDHALEPFGFAALRYGAAAVVLMAIGLTPTRRRRLGSLTRRDLYNLVGLGIVFYGVTQGSQFVAIGAQPAATTSLILSLTPLVVGLASMAMIGERPAKRQLLGTGLIALGAAFYSAGELGATRVGIIAALIGLGANSASALMGRVVNRAGAMTAYVVTAVSMTVGATALAITALAIEGGIPVPDPEAWLIIFWLAVVNTALAFTLWNWSLSRLHATESAALNNTMTIQIALLAWLFLSEALGPGEIAGILLVTAGILLAHRRWAGS